MSGISIRLIALAAGWLTGAPALAQPSCTLTQITATSRSFFRRLRHHPDHRHAVRQRFRHAQPRRELLRLLLERQPDGGQSGQEPGDLPGLLQRPGSRSPSRPRPGLGGAPRLPVQGPDHGRRPGLRRDPGGRLRRRDAVRERCPAGPFRALFAGHRPPAERIPVGEPGAVHAEAMALEIDTHPAGSANVFTFRITERVGFRPPGSLQCSRKNVPGMAIVHFAQRSWLTEILINSGAAQGRPPSRPW